MIRVVALLGAAGVIVVAGLGGAAKSEPSVTASVQAFLLAWDSGDYPAAAAMTTGNRAAVAESLQAAYSELGAQNLALAMGSITVTGNTARAYFQASIDLGRGGRPWNYQGSMTLRRSGSRWLVVWSPSVIAPGLGRNERLAVETTLPGREELLDSAGKPLIPPSPAIQLGVKPGKVRDVRLTARALAKATGLAASDADEMSGQILAAPPQAFLELVQLSPKDYAHLRKALATVPDLRHRTVIRPLFASTVPEVTGKIGTETAKVLVQDGDSYLPGTTVGLSGLQQAFQASLVGTPTTEVIVQNSAGKQVKVLRSWQGRPGSPVRTTINASVERAARRALAGSAGPAAIVAVRASTGQVLAVGSHSGAGMPAVSPLHGQYQPGQAFAMITTAALFSAGKGLGVNSPVRCLPTQKLNGQAFANVPAVPGLGKPKFSEDFAHACSTAFAALSTYYLSPNGLVTAARQFGIGVPWQLPIAVFTGRMAKPSSTNSPALPADATGNGTVQVSPLDMALAAGVVESGSWHQPSLTSVGGQPRQAGEPALKTKVISELRQLMAQTVRSGVARAARVGGAPLYGQVGIAPLAGHRHIRAIWFVGFRGDVAFAVLTFSRSTAFDPAVSIAHRFAVALTARS